MAFSPNGWLLASVSDEEAVQIWNTSTGALEKTLSLTLGPIPIICSPRGKYRALMDWERKVHIWQRDAETLPNVIVSQEGKTCLSLSPILCFPTTIGRLLQAWDVC
jgi:WD40 repeat protein